MAAWESSPVGHPISRLIERILAEFQSLSSLLSLPAPFLAPVSVPATPASLHTLSCAAGCTYIPSPGSPLASALCTDFLLSEIQVCRMLVAAGQASAGPATVTVEVLTPPLCKAVGVPPTVEVHKAMMQVVARVRQLKSSLPPSALATHPPLLHPSHATVEVVAMLQDLNAAFQVDYAARRALLLKRFDLTLASFLWSPRASSRTGEVEASIAPKRRALGAAPASIQVGDAFAVGLELSSLLSRRVTDGGDAQFRSSSVKSVRIGGVPDRGGRVADMALTAHDIMPSWSARKAQAGAQRSGRDARAVAIVAAAGEVEGEARGDDGDFESAMREDGPPAAAGAPAASGAASSRGGAYKPGRGRGGRGRGRGGGR